jgi:hypothetical protein
MSSSFDDLSYLSDALDNFDSRDYVELDCDCSSECWGWAGSVLKILCRQLINFF